MNELIIIVAFLSVLSIGAIVADHIIPHIKPLNDLMKKLPMFWDE